MRSGNETNPNRGGSGVASKADTLPVQQYSSSLAESGALI